MGTSCLNGSNMMVTQTPELNSIDINDKLKSNHTRSTTQTYNPEQLKKMLRDRVKAKHDIGDEKKDLMNNSRTNFFQMV